jgi:hypothetical protein
MDPICGPEFFAPDERQQGARLSADLDLTLRSTAWLASKVGVQVSFVSPYDASLPWDTRFDPQFAGRSLCATTLPNDYYRGLIAKAPAPPFGPGDLAGDSAVLHMNANGYTAMAWEIITEAPPA